MKGCCGSTREEERLQSVGWHQRLRSLAALYAVCGGSGIFDAQMVMQMA